MGAQKESEKISCSIAYNWHDSSVSFSVGNKVVLVLEAERVFRQKKKLCNQEEMEYLIKCGLNSLGKSTGDVDYWSMTTLNNPYLDKSDALDANREIRGPYWKEVSIFGSTKKVLIINHHLAHAGIYLATKFKKAVIVSCDGGGDFNPKINTEECLVVYKGDGDKIIRQDINSDFITGKTYGVCSTFLYNNEIHSSKSSEGKLMALAGFGEVRDEYYNFLKENFHKIEMADYTEVLKVLEDSVSNLKGQATLETKDSKDFAATVQRFFVDKRLEDMDFIIEEVSTDEEAIILTGGASLNLDFNTAVMKKYPNFKHFVAPCCDDTGQSLGALCILINQTLALRPEINFPYLGEGQEKFDYTPESLDKAVDILIKDGVLILHNGKAEIGPRALGNRSFVARPDSLKVKKKLSEKIKQRESYRPVAPVVLEEKVNEYFIGPKESPFMLYRYEVIESQINKVIGVVHVDNSARAQTVARGSNPFLYDLIKKFGEKTGVYVLLNTSLNLQGVPITNKIEESQDVYNKIPGPKGIIYNGKLLESSCKN